MIADLINTYIDDTVRPEIEEVIENYKWNLGFKQYFKFYLMKIRLKIFLLLFFVQLCLKFDQFYIFIEIVFNK